LGLQLITIGLFRTKLYVSCLLRSIHHNTCMNNNLDFLQAFPFFIN